MVRRATQVCVAALLALCLGSRVSADTLVTGGNFVGANVWTPAGSPYIVVGDSTVPFGASLTIQAGVSVRVGSTDALASGLDAARVELRVANGGTLQVQGTGISPVTFRAHMGTATNTWYGIVVENGAAQVSLQSALVEHAVQALRTSAPANVVGLSNTTFQNNEIDLSIIAAAGTPSVSGVLTAGRYQGNFTLTGILSLNRIASIGQGNFAMPAAPTRLQTKLTSSASYEKLAVTGTVTLGGALELDVDGLLASPGEVFTLLDNDGVDAVTGTFLGLPEGVEFVMGTHRFRVSYLGGTGNDVTLTVVSPAVPVFPALRAD